MLICVEHKVLYIQPIKHEIQCYNRILFKLKNWNQNNNVYIFHNISERVSSYFFKEMSVM